ncbi:hypothetical protein PFISCL1PPCAC_20096, partial [Pristionchus fissidentatus]
HGENVAREWMYSRSITVVGASTVIAKMSMDGRPISFTVSEWHRVQSLFNSDSLEDLKECHIILTAWNHRIPMVAVVCCEMVVSVLIGAKLELPPEFAYMKLDTMRRQCAIAVIRFVNYINEMGQPGGIGKPLEMKKAVAPFGVPAWLVDMRHEATHNELPILERLQKGLAFARKWLWDNFWTRPVHEAMEKAVAPGGDPNEIVLIDGEMEKRKTTVLDSATIRRHLRLQSLLVEFVEWRASNSSFSIATCGLMDRPEILIHIENALLQEPYDLLKVLIADGFLILNEDQLEAFKNFDPYGGSIPERVQLFWDPIATMCFENHAMQLFIVELMERLRDPLTVPSSRAQLITWTKMFLEGALATKIFSVREWSSVLSSMLALPGIFSRNVLRQVMERLPNLEEKRKGQVHRIMDISMHDEDGNLMEDSMTVKTIDDLKAAIDADMNKPNTEASLGVWTMSTEKDWRSLPLGMIPSQHFDSFSLIIDDSMLSTWGIVPSGPMNWNAVYDEQTPSRSAVRQFGSTHSTSSAHSSNSAPSTSVANGQSSSSRALPSTSGNKFARPEKIGKRKSGGEKVGGGDDSFIESMKKTKKKKRKMSVVTIESD